MTISRRDCIATLLFCLLVFSDVAHTESFFTSFEFSNSGTFSIGEAPLTASFAGGSAQTIGVGAYYHSGLFSWHVPNNGLATVTFETPVDSVDFWFRDTAGAASSSYRIYDSNGIVIDSGGGGQSWVNILLSRSGAQARIARMEFESAGGGDTVVDDFAYTGTTTEPEPEPEPEPVPVPVPVPEPEPEPEPNNPIEKTIDTSSIGIELQELIIGLAAPIWATIAPGDSNGLYIVDQAGVIIRLDISDNSISTFFDLTSRLVPLGNFGPESYDERGLLGLAFHPNYQGNGLFYTFTSEPADSVADFSTLSNSETADHQSVIAEWRVVSPLEIGSAVVANSRRELLRIDQPQFNHNGGNLAFGPDGNLFISLGDGGNADDEGAGHGSQGNGSDNTTILGSLLRIDPTGNTSANGQYGVPSDNPLIGDTPVTEIYASGFRNPYRFSFDANNAALWLADVGQNSIEEIDLVEAGGDYGWNAKEGSYFFAGNGNAAGSVSSIDPGVPADLIDPVAEYDHDDGIAVIGGFVYRGSAIDTLRGRYVFGDFGSFGANAGRVFHLDESHQILAFDVGVNTRLPLAVLGFGQDTKGELYLLTNTTGTPFGATGKVYRIAPNGADGITRNQATAIARLYAAAFDRFPKQEGLNFWIDSHESGRNLVDIARRFVVSPEFTDKYGQLDNAAFVAQLFRNILGREAVQSGIDFWKGHLDDGVSRAKTLSQLSDSPENRTKTENYDLREDGEGEWIFCTTDPDSCLN